CQWPRCWRPVGRTPLTTTRMRRSPRQVEEESRQRAHQRRHDVGVHEDEKEEEKADALEHAEDAGLTPWEQGPQHPPTVERRDGKEVEDGEQAVDLDRAAG